MRVRAGEEAGEEMCSQHMMSHCVQITERNGAQATNTPCSPSAPPSRTGSDAPVQNKEGKEEVSHVLLNDPSRFLPRQSSFSEL